MKVELNKKDEERIGLVILTLFIAASFGLGYVFGARNPWPWHPVEVTCPACDTPIEIEQESYSSYTGTTWVSYYAKRIDKKKPTPPVEKAGDE